MRFLLPNTSSSIGRLFARMGLTLLALLFFGGGALSAWQLGGAPLRDAWRSRNWQQVTATLEDVALSDMSAQGVKLTVIYRYRVDDREYQGNRYGPHVWMDNADAQREAYADLLYRRRTQAWVNPARPEEALLNRDVHWSVALMALPALGAAGLGAVLFWAAGVGNAANWQARWRAIRRRLNHRANPP
jgi:hypothetical protein